MSVSSSDESDVSSSSFSYISKSQSSQSSLAVSQQHRLSSFENLSTGTNTNMDESDTDMDKSDTDTTNINEANEKEKNWWLGKGSLGALGFDEKRLPLVLKRGVTFDEFVKRVEKKKARKFFDYQDGTVTLIELPSGKHEVARTTLSYLFTKAFDNASKQDSIYNWGAKSLFTNLPSNEYEEPDACFMPKRLANPRIPALNPCDAKGNPWPTIIFEVAHSETLKHVKKKLNRHWLAPNRCEDVIVIKISKQSGPSYNNNNETRPLRRLQCLKFCRAATLRQNPNATRFEAVETIDFGSVYGNGTEGFFCTGPHMEWLTIDCGCIFAGCTPPIPSFYEIISSTPFHPHLSPYPLQTPGVAIDLFDIQQAIFDA